ncbi:RDD family protein [Nocardiopsis sp. CNT-189]|uniref:RDD family protein n=1 Tax=Nocardiopsis oceanisediminis TaxID=2816862 RepID=UPI003B379C9E
MDPSYQNQPGGQGWPQQGHGYQQQAYGQYQQGHPQQGYGQYQQQEMLPPGLYAAEADKRLFAALIDAAIMMVILFVTIGVTLGLTMALTFAMAGDSEELTGGAAAVLVIGIVLTYAFAFLAPFLYRWLSHTRKGRTLGKRMLGLHVVNLETGGGLPAKGRTFVRELVYCLLGWISCLWILWDPRKQALHDKVGNTAVVVSD